MCLQVIDEHGDLPHTCALYCLDYAAFEAILSTWNQTAAVVLYAYAVRSSLCFLEEAVFVWKAGRQAGRQHSSWLPAMCLHARVSEALSTQRLID